jgi:serine/threonine-protein kinase
MEETQKLGRYEITGVLGQGAMGVVYKARDPLLDRIVAIKTINMGLEQEEKDEYGLRFEQEARAAGGLNHPNIITIYDVGSSGDTAYMAMEFLEGRELRHILASDGTMPVAQAIDIAAQVADGLAYAHECQVVHRDIKPANIMIVRGGRAKITDFGIARMRSSQVKTQTGMVLGSPKYMSPEQVMGLRADGRSDIFSLGVMLYEMLTGNAPFRGDSITALMFQVLNTVPTPPRQIISQVPEMLNFVVAKALAKKAEERYQNAQDFANDLRECAKTLGSASASITAAPAPAATPPQPAAAPPAADSPEAATEILDMFKTAPRTRYADGGEVSEEPLTLGVSKTFDSYEATLRVSAQTGMVSEFEEFAKTQKVARPAPSATELADTVIAHTEQYEIRAEAPAEPAPSTKLAQMFVQYENQMLGAGIAVAVVIAAAIILI